MQLLFLELYIHHIFQLDIYFRVTEDGHQAKNDLTFINKLFSKKKWFYCLAESPAKQHFTISTM